MTTLRGIGALFFSLVSICSLVIGISMFWFLEPLGIAIMGLMAMLFIWTTQIAFFLWPKAWSKGGKKYEQIRHDIEEMAFLPFDWDTYGSNRIQDDAISRALIIVNEAEKLGIFTGWAIPTSDETILLFLTDSGGEQEWEIGTGDTELAVSTRGSFALSRSYQVCLPTEISIREKLKLLRT